MTKQIKKHITCTLLNDWLKSLAYNYIKILILVKMTDNTCFVNMTDNTLWGLKEKDSFTWRRYQKHGPKIICIPLVTKNVYSSLWTTITQIRKLVSRVIPLESKTSQVGTLW